MKPGRNDPCICGSGKKFKHCCESKVARLPQTPSSAQLSQLNALLNTGRYTEVESLARSLLDLYPGTGFIWNILSVSLHMQGKDPLLALQKAAYLLPDDAGVHNNLGNALHGLRQFKEAAASYRRALQIKPSFIMAHNNLGICLQALGQHDAALASYRSAVGIEPKHAEAHNNLGNALKELGQLDGAAASYRKAVALEPNYAKAYNNLGNVLKELGQLDGAAASYRKAVALEPNYAEAHSNLGYALKELGQLDAAVTSCGRALELKPDFAEAHNNLGLALLELGQADAAASSFRRTLELKSDFAAAHSNLGYALKELGQLDAAVTSCRRALELKPDFADAHNNLGIALNELRQFDTALISYRSALKIKPDFVEVYNNMGITLKDLGQFDAALSSYQHALHLKPDYAVAHCNLGNVLQELGQLDSAMASYRRALELKPDYAELHSCLQFVLNYTDHTPENLLQEAHQFGRMVNKKVSSRFSSWLCTEQPERLRVGLVSGDLRNHSVGHFLEGLLAHIDPARIELIAYPTYHEQDELTARIRPYFSAWHPLFGLSDEAAARLIHADGVHVLLDLSGHTKHNALPVFAWKPAPVQVTWLGLPATTGVAEMDYVLADPHALPPEFESHFSEAVWRMPDSCLCLAVPASPVQVVPLPALAAGYVTFASFNNLSKMTDAVVAVWARILKSVPDSRLLLKTKQLVDPGVCENTRQRFAACGIAPDRLLLGGTLASRADHLAAYNKVDIALDTFPYPGVTTSVEALWMGVPVLSLRGDRFMSRTAGSIAHNAGLPDWVAADEEEYVAKAVAFASDLGRLAALRAGLRQQVLASPLFDAPRFARDFEEALWGMWQARTQGNSPTPAAQLSAARN